MRADQPVVPAASWIVSASMERAQPYQGCVKVQTGQQRPRGPRHREPATPALAGSALGRGEDALARLVSLLVEPRHRPDGRRSLPEALDDLRGLHLVVALPRSLDAQLRAGRGGALGLD